MAKSKISKMKTKSSTLAISSNIMHHMEKEN